METVKLVQLSKYGETPIDVEVVYIDGVPSYCKTDINETDKQDILNSLIKYNIK